METVTVYWLLTALACTPQEIVVPYGSSPPGTIVWGPNTFTTATTGTDTDSASDVEDTARSSTTHDEGLAVGDLAPDLYASTSEGTPWALHEQRETILLIAGNADGVALGTMLEQTALLPQSTRQVLLVGNNVYATPATPVDATAIQERYPHLGTVLLDPTLENVNTWSERAPPKAYLIDRNHVILWSAFRSIETTQLSELMSSSP